MPAALRLPLPATGYPAGIGWHERLVVPLLGGDDDGQVNVLLPVWRAAAANPRMSSGHRTSEDGGKARGSKCKAVVPGHGQILPPKKKNAMRKIILAKGYAMRKTSRMETTSKKGQAGQPSKDARKVQTLAIYDATEEFNFDMRGICPVNNWVKFASFEQARKALAELGITTETHMGEELVNLAFVYRSTFRDTYTKIAAKHGGINY